MRCEEFKRSIIRDLDGEASAGEVESLKRHLEACESCRHLQESFSRIDSLHRGLEEHEVPESIVEAVLREVEDVGTVRMAGWLRIATAAAAAVVVFLGVKVGGYLDSAFFTPEKEVAVLELEHLDEYPPDSIGDILIAAAEGGEDE